jgi:uncharacterized OsmC-like protein
MATTYTLPKRTNGVAVDDLVSTVNAIKQTPTLAKFQFRVRNQWIDGPRSQSTADSFYGAGQEQSHAKPFVLDADEPPVLLGKDIAPNAGEYLLHTLAVCMTTTIVYHAAARGIDIEEVESSLEGDVDLQGFLGLDESVRKGFQGIRVNFKIKADVPDEQLQEICQLAKQYSSVFDTLTKGVPIAVTANRF